MPMITATALPPMASRKITKRAACPPSSGMLASADDRQRIDRFFAEMRDRVGRNVDQRQVGWRRSGGNIALGNEQRRQPLGELGELDGRIGRGTGAARYRAADRHRRPQPRLDRGRAIAVGKRDARRAVGLEAQRTRATRSDDQIGFCRRHQPPEAASRVIIHAVDRHGDDSIVQHA